MSGGRKQTLLDVARPVHDIHHPLRVGITKVGMVRFTIVHHCFINGVRGLVRKDTGRQARHDFGALCSSISVFLLPWVLHGETGYIGLLGAPQKVVVHQVVVTVKVELVLHVLEQTADHGGQVDDMRRLVFLEERFRIRHAPNRCLA